MKQITINVPDSKFPLALDLIKNLKFVKKVTTSEEVVDAPPTKKEFIRNLKKAFDEEKLIESGKKKASL